MKIISYNVNGIRAAMRKGLTDWLSNVNADVVCLQEIKAQEDQVDTDAVAELGFKYQYYYPAQKKGYSGVAIWSKTEPNQVAYGTGIEYMDAEGRNLRADFDDYSIMSLYLPSGTNDARLDLKFQYMDDFSAYVEQLRNEVSNLVICGDYNICHTAMDIHDPVRLKNTSGFLPEERAWLDTFINSGMVDSFRLFNDQPDNYTWWSYRGGARERNKGWRLDYHLVAEPIKDKIKRSVILKDAMHSDHCPVLLELD
jgi:exodeoxyribonuclease-3